MEHRLQRAPHRLQVSFSGEKGSCPFCGTVNFTAPTCHSCGVACDDDLKLPARRGRKVKKVEEEFPIDTHEHEPFYEEAA